MSRTTIVIAGLCVVLLAFHSPAGAQDCPPAVKAMAPPNGTVRSCAYAPLATTMSVQFSGDVPRPDLPDQPYVFSLKVNRMKLPALARRIDMI